MVEGTDDLSGGAVPARVEGLERHDSRRRRDADDPEPVGVERGCGDTGHVRAMAVVVLGDRARADAVETVRQIEVGREIGMIRVDAGVDQRHPGAGTAIGPLRIGD